MRDEYVVDCWGTRSYSMQYISWVEALYFWIYICTYYCMVFMNSRLIYFFSQTESLHLYKEALLSLKALNNGNFNCKCLSPRFLYQIKQHGVQCFILDVEQARYIWFWFYKMFLYETYFTKFYKENAKCSRFKHHDNFAIELGPF